MTCRMNQTSCSFQFKATMKHVFILLMLFWNNVEITLTEQDQFCKKPLIDYGEVQEDKDKYGHNEVLTFSCDPGYKKVDSEPSVCSKVNCLRWSSTPQCEVMDCGAPEPVLNGGVSFLSGEPNQYGSVVQYYCDEPYYSLPHGAMNVSFRCEADGKWRAVNDSGLIPICLPVCGKPRVDFSGIHRIIGGNDAPQGSIPWQVRISGGGGGMLIADRWVLTAALVLLTKNGPRPTNEVKMFWGTNNWTDFQVPNAIAASVHLHPGYNNPNGRNFDNDIALIKLPAPVTFNTFVMPICLPPEDATLQSRTGVVSGFGLIKTAARGISLSKTLQYVHLPVVDPSTCTKSLDILKRTYPNVPEETHNMFCAGLPDGKKDCCQGDHGGPFALWSNDHYWAAGIVSWGVGCAEAGRYGFYTRVSNYVDWIHKTMKEN